MDRTVLRNDWKAERERIDLAAVAVDLLGPPPGRSGDRGRRLWWHCPYHEDGNPSFAIEPGKDHWRCYGCGENGDAAKLVMKIKDISFPEAVAYLTGGTSLPDRNRIRPKPPPPARGKAREAESRLKEAEALSLVAEATARLSGVEGRPALAQLAERRGLNPETIRAARLGVVVKPLDLPGRPRGVVIPWFDGDRLTLVKVRQPEGREPKYYEVFRRGPTIFPGATTIQLGQPLVIVEGELDAALLGQQLDDLAAVVTLGSASARPTTDILERMLAASRWYIGTDADPAGDKAAEGWPARAIRVRPPNPFKDWTEAWQGRVNLRRWWSDRLGGIENPSMFVWSELLILRLVGPFSEAPAPSRLLGHGHHTIGTRVREPAPPRRRPCRRRIFAGRGRPLPRRQRPLRPQVGRRSSPG